MAIFMPHGSAPAWPAGRPPGQLGISPFVELNRLHNDVGNGIRLDEAGLQGKLSKSLSVWGHLGTQRGGGGFERYEIQVGLGWQWQAAGGRRWTIMY